MLRSMAVRRRRVYAAFIILEQLQAIVVNFDYFGLLLTFSPVTWSLIVSHKSTDRAEGRCNREIGKKMKTLQGVCPCGREGLATALACSIMQVPVV